MAWVVLPSPGLLSGKRGKEACSDPSNTNNTFKASVHLTSIPAAWWALTMGSAGKGWRSWLQLCVFQSDSASQAVKLLEFRTASHNDQLLQVCLSLSRQDLTV